MAPHNLFTVSSFTEGLVIYGTGWLVGASFGALAVVLDVLNKRGK